MRYDELAGLVAQARALALRRHGPEHTSEELDLVAHVLLRQAAEQVRPTFKRGDRGEQG
jgi:hypothetical protein